MFRVFIGFLYSYYDIKNRASDDTFLFEQYPAATHVHSPSEYKYPLVTDDGAEMGASVSDAPGNGPTRVRPTACTGFFEFLFLFLYIFSGNLRREDEFFLTFFNAGIIFS